MVLGKKIKDGMKMVPGKNNLIQQKNKHPSRFSDFRGYSDDS